MGVEKRPFWIETSLYTKLTGMYLMTLTESPCYEVTGGCGNREHANVPYASAEQWICMIARSTKTPALIAFRRCLGAPVDHNRSP